MRKVTDHIINQTNDRIQISILDEPGAGGANHYYAVDVDGSENGLDVVFQNGPAWKERALAHMARRVDGKNVA